MRPRVLLAGLFHETHTFLDERTGIAAFAVKRGDELLDAAGDASVLAGAVEAADVAGWEVIPAVDYTAAPGGTVADEAVEAFWRELRAVAAPALREGVDGIFLVLHGAMVSESIADVEGEILRRLRGLPGAADLPIGGTLDLHANVSAAMAALTQGLVAYRKNPHTDAKETAVRAVALLDRLIRGGGRPTTVHARPRLLWPPTGTATAMEPMRGLEVLAREIERAHRDIRAVNVLAGFSFADTPEAGVSFTAVTEGDAAAAQRELERLGAHAWRHRTKGAPVDVPLEAVMPKLRRHERGPVLLVEPADNIGGGAPGDGTAVLRALLAHDVDDAVVVINDPQAVAAVSGAPRARVRIGGKGSRLDPGPVELQVELVSTSDGRFQLEDASSHLAAAGGRQVEMGPCAVVRHRGLRVLLTSRRTPPWDLGQLRSQGIRPERCAVIGIKAAVAHRRAYDPIAAASYTVDTPGPCSSNLRAFPYRRVSRPVFPLD